MLCPVETKTGERKLPPPPKPKCVLTSRQGCVRHLFAISNELASKLSKGLVGEDWGRSFLFGAITSEGWVQIWDFNRRRTVLAEDTGVRNSIWGTILERGDEIVTYIHSRTEGLHSFVGFPINRSGGEQCSIAAHPGFCHSEILFSKDLIVYPGFGKGSEDNECKVFNMDLELESIALPPVPPLVFIKALDTDGGWVVCGCESGDIYVLDISTCLVVSKANLGDRKEGQAVMGKESAENVEVPFCCDYERVSSNLLVGTSHSNLYLFHLPELLLLNVIKITNAGTSCISFRQDGRIVATCGADNRIRLFSFPAMKPLAVLTHHSNSITAVAFFLNPQLDYHWLISCSDDSTLAVWDVFNRKK